MFDVVKIDIIEMRLFKFLLRILQKSLIINMTHIT